MDAHTHAVLLLLALMLSAAAARSDLRTGLIPNRLLLAGLVALLTARAVLALASAESSALLRTLGIAALGGVLSSIVPLLLYQFHGIGGGDVKLFAALGLGLGPRLSLEAQQYAFALLLLYAPARLAYQGKLLSSLAAALRLARRPFMRAVDRPLRQAREHSVFRFAPAIFGGCAIATLSHWGGA